MIPKYWSKLRQRIVGSFRLFSLFFLVVVGFFIISFFISPKEVKAICQCNFSVCENPDPWGDICTTPENPALWRVGYANGPGCTDSSTCTEFTSPLSDPQASRQISCGDCLWGYGDNSSLVQYGFCIANCEEAGGGGNCEGWHIGSCSAGCPFGQRERSRYCESGGWEYGCYTPPQQIACLDCALPENQDASGLWGEYFEWGDSDTLKYIQESQVKDTRIDSTVDFDWGEGSPAPNTGSDTFIVRWTGFVNIPQSGDWTFTQKSDSGYNLYIDGSLVIGKFWPPSIEGGSTKIQGVKFVWDNNSWKQIEPGISQKVVLNEKRVSIQSLADDPNWQGLYEFFNINNGNHWVYVTVPDGYKVSFNACEWKSSGTCENFDSGERNWVVVNLEEDTIYNIDWYFTPPGTANKGFEWSSGTVALDAGWHDIRIEYAEAVADSIVRIYYEGPGVAKQIIPTTSLNVCTAATDLTPPICSLSGPTSVTVNTSVTYTATGSDLEGNLTEVEIWKSPTSNQSWSSVVDGCVGPTCQGSTSFTTEGTYYITCNAFDSTGNKCSGNPWCSEFSPLATPEMDCTGWSDCTTSDLLTVTVTDPDPWWQVIDADVLTDGDIISSIPLSCALPGCNPLFGLEGLGGFPGVPIYGGSTAGFGEGDVSSTGWLANTQSLFSRIYDYSFFSRLVRPDVELTEVSSRFVNGGFFTSGGVSSRGYVWYHFDGATLGDLTITGDMNIIGDRKVVLLVEGADLNINGRITLQKEGEGFFMVIVGKDANGNKGNIFVNASVVHDTKPELQGVFLAEAQFKTGAGDEQLHIRGMVAAYDGVVLERDLTDNSTEPAEVFEFAPDLIFTYPRDLTFKKIRWKEVAP